jgi:hypothetical protein
MLNLQFQILLSRGSCETTIRQALSGGQGRFEKNLMRRAQRKLCAFWMKTLQAISDKRWHTGHELQQENYSVMLEEVIRTPWLGVIFKPKTSGDIRS